MFSWNMFSGAVVLDKRKKSDLKFYQTFNTKRLKFNFIQNFRE